jgi:hypothetical protein
VTALAAAVRAVRHARETRARYLVSPDARPLGPITLEEELAIALEAAREAERTELPGTPGPVRIVGLAPVDANGRVYAPLPLDDPFQVAENQIVTAAWTTLRLEIDLPGPTTREGEGP